MRGPARGVVTAVLVVALAGCSIITRTHRATVLEAPMQPAEADLSDRWVVLVHLENGDIEGAEEVFVGFDRRALLCDDGSELLPEDLEVGAVVRFVWERGAVDSSDPPGIRSREIRAEC